MRLVIRSDDSDVKGLFLVTKVSRSLTVVVLTNLLGCSAPYYSPPAPAYQHTYTTDTQAAHKLTGITLFHTGGNSVDWYVDGRLVASHRTGFVSSPDFNTFVQLPPGEHEIVFEAYDDLLGVRDDRGFYRVAFTLSPGENGRVISKAASIVSNVTGTLSAITAKSCGYSDVRSIEGVRHYRLVEKREKCTAEKRRIDVRTLD